MDIHFFVSYHGHWSSFWSKSYFSSNDDSNSNCPSTTRGTMRTSSQKDWMSLTLTLGPLRICFFHLNIKQVQLWLIQDLSFEGRSSSFLVMEQGNISNKRRQFAFGLKYKKELRIQVDIYFFVSYHGHNVCDVHACHIKLRILRLIRKFSLANFRRKGQLMDAVSSIKNTHSFVLPTDAIKRDDSEPVLAKMLDKPLRGIRSFHHFLYLSE